uniref:Uncharacterized protein n=1 Tax=Anopheles farauti TaxID=69004 RepID=A0A182QSI6_9DIPT
MYNWNHLGARGTASASSSIETLDSTLSTNGTPNVRAARAVAFSPSGCARHCSATGAIPTGIRRTNPFSWCLRICRVATTSFRMSIQAFLVSQLEQQAKQPLEHVRNEFILCGVHDECALLNILSNAQETQVPHTALAQQTSIGILA